MLTFSPDDYRALREAAGMRERRDAALIGVAGRDRLSYLHAMLTNDIAALTAGRGCYAAYLTPQGRMIADMVVVELGDLALMRLDAARKTEVFEKLDQFIFSEDVQLHDLSETLTDIEVIGPRSPHVLSTTFTASKDEFGALPQLHAHRTEYEGASAVIVSAGNQLGVPAFDVYLDRVHAPGVSGAMKRAGAVAVADEAVEALRIEAGVPRFGADMDEHTIPLEAGIEGRAISFTKGCYPGQEVITRVLHRGHGRVARKLAGLAVEGATVPEPGDRLVVAGKDVGTVTSAVYSPTLGRAVALGYLQRDLAAPGTAVQIVRSGDLLSANVVPLPFIP
ncbi:MAG: YgfZ/GcvT domain-containing protein [Bacteroidales bacterium]